MKFKGLKNENNAQGTLDKEWLNTCIAMDVADAQVELRKGDRLGRSTVIMLPSKRNISIGLYIDAII